jgi:hypothetical protein
MEKQTKEQIAAKAAELEKRENRKVYPFAFETKEGEQIVGYMLEPNRQAKMACIDEMTKSITVAGSKLLEACLLKNDSDPRISSDKPEDDAIYISAALNCMQFMQTYTDTLKN